MSAVNATEGLYQAAMGHLAYRLRNRTEKICPLRL